MSFGDTFYRSTNFFHPYPIIFLSRGNMYEQYLFSPEETLPNISQALVKMIEIADFPTNHPLGVDTITYSNAMTLVYIHNEPGCVP